VAKAGIPVQNLESRPEADDISCFIEAVLTISSNILPR